ncbi:cytochrome-c peroxidase [Vibrio inusitatus NBRC 102082]|uniref:Cytochrome-c peroxidase n=1 Tax=Vibrio inusitatus NBRC 102082 TaxID=1219070 RepID=A0A4Y3HYE0_9VIBR|nr:cytochrome c peroxidase [Vibrio inusitatus]GEA51702.1 cytochrome-c peroxidase [Vibrio inusitatus NBRC 102082]
MSRPFIRLGLSIFLTATLVGCNSSDDSDDDTIQNENTSVPTLPEENFNYANLNLPEHLTQNDFPGRFQFQYAATDFDNTPVDNTVTNAGATLGRVLFYDKRLSANGTISCSSCHQAQHAFSDPEIQSRGFDGELTRRHSMGLVNARFFFSGKFFWDERAGSLEEQVLMPFQDPIEMGLILAELEEIVTNQSYYPELFRNAFGDENISSDRIARALAQFIRSLVSTTAKYDIARSEVQSPIVDFPAFTEQENTGKSLFFLPRELADGTNVNCAGCHVTEAFAGPIPNDLEQITTHSTNNGLDAESTNDQGIFESTQNRRDQGKFKAPSLRNIAVRAPFMHDGRFNSLEAVIEHYSSGIQAHPRLSAPLLDSEGNPVRFDFTEQEKEALVAFLNTLTDDDMLNDEKFSNPFN